MPDLAGFTHRFFRELFRRMPRPSSLVLDNFQDAHQSGRLATITRDATAEIPAGINLVVISREQPPAEFARLRINEALATVDWEALRLTFEETIAIASLRGLHDEAAVHYLHERSRGWAAGLTVLIERTGENACTPATTEAAPQALFDYFATETFEQSPAKTRDLWLRTAYLPRFTAGMARHLTGNKAAQTLLDDLHDRHYFIDRRQAITTHYQYHALFREFLYAQSARLLTPAERHQLAAASAAVLDEHGDFDGALELYQVAGDDAARVRLILAQAPVLQAQGRWQTLKRWIDSVAAQMVESEPWLLFWRGACAALIDPRCGRTILERAFEAFARHQDALGQALAAAAIIDTYFFEWAQFKSLDCWIEVLQNFLSEESVLPSRQLELRVLASIALAILYRQPKNPFLHECVNRIQVPRCSPCQSCSCAAAWCR